MAVSQYIGARYVPLFFTNPDDNSNNWKSGVIYDPLTIVTDLNQSYTSKIPVPASVGRPSENPTYWILTGAYNAQVNTLTEEVENLREDVSGFNTALENTAEELSNDISDLSDTVTNEFKNVVFVGDSYATLYDTTWIEYLVDYMGIPTYRKTARGGCGFIGYQTDTFGTLLTSLATNMSETERAKVTAVVVGGGANDGEANATALLEAIKAFKTNAATLFPNAKLYVCFMAWSLDATQKANVRQAYKNYCKFVPSSGMRLLADCGIPLHNSYYLDSTSPIHPTQAGEQSLAMVMCTALLTGSYAWSETQNIQITPANGWTLQNAAVSATLDGIEHQVAIYSSALGNGVELTFGGEYVIGTYPTGNVLPITTPWIPTAFTWSYQQNVGLCRIRLNNGNVELNWRGPTLAANAGGYLGDATISQHYMEI